LVARKETVPPELPRWRSRGSAGGFKSRNSVRRGGRETQPKYPFGHYLLELLYFDTGETVRAIPELETALRLAPQEPQFYFAMGNAYVKAGRKQEAARARASFIRLQRKEGSESGPTAYGEAHNPDPARPQSSAPQP
jgi:tetratricopeptide (TPR) repeat protein